MVNTIQVTMSSDNIAIIRYIIIPAAGFFIGALFFLLIYRNYSSKFFEGLETYVKGHLNQIFLFAVAIYSLFFLSIVILRYSSHHIGFFDFGIYDFRIWQIHDISWIEWHEKLKSAVMGYFQPILVVYSILYDFGIDPVILNILQAVTVLSGIIPLYLIAKNKIRSHLLILSVLLIYLLYPATQFNIAVDFHPDHLIIPILFWCYYLIEKEKYYWTIPLVLIGYTLKEPLILAIAFMGLYIGGVKRKYVFGFVVFFISLVVFYIVTFAITPGEAIARSNSFGYIFEPEGLFPFLQEVLRFEKWRFPFFLLFPLLFLPLLKFKVFLPALPLLIIHIISTNIHHQNVASHYTAGIIPPVFVALISAISYLYDRFKERITIGILSWIVILLLAFNVAHSPSPLAVAFWNKAWSYGKWHYSMYIKSEHERLLEDVINLIPDDPQVKVVTHSEIYHKKLAHRYFYRPFPEGWQEADYIILDNTRGPYLSDGRDEVGYQQKLQELKDNPEFKVIFNKDGILVFARRR